MAITLQRHRNGSFTVGFARRVIGTTVTSSSGDAFRWLFDLHWRHPRFSGLVIGLAIEQRPVLPSSADQRTVAVLQLCVDQQCLIFHIVLADWIPILLVRLLRCRTCRFVGVDVAAVASLLRHEYRLVVRNAVDLGELAAERMGRTDLRGADISVLAREVAGIDVRTGAVTSPWDQRPLSMNQIVKACTDAFLASEVGRLLI